MSRRACSLRAALRLPPSRWAAALGVVVLAALAGAPGCKERSEFSAGAPCNLTSECQEPLVCRLDRCRVECALTRDCLAGFTCVRDASGLPVCQVQADLNCLQDSDCSSPLACRQGRCVNACADYRDCPAGQECTTIPDAGAACADPLTDTCARNSDCTAPLVCAIDHRCRVECREDRDCAPPEVCGTVMGMPACVAPTDGGP